MLKDKEIDDLYVTMCLSYCDFVGLFSVLFYMRMHFSYKHT